MEVSIQYPTREPKILTADLAGWRRARVEKCPQEYPVTQLPDWVCEVCFTTQKKDTRIVPFTLAEAGVPWYWFADAEHDNLQVFELTDRGYVLRMSLFRDDGVVAIPPFESVPVSVGQLFGDDPQD